MATKITADSESLAPGSSKWSTVTFSLYRTVFKLFAVFFLMGFPISGQIGEFCHSIPLNGQVSHTKGILLLPCMGTSVLDHWERRFGAPWDVYARRRKSVKRGRSCGLPLTPATSSTIGHTIRHLLSQNQNVRCMDNKSELDLLTLKFKKKIDISRLALDIFMRGLNCYSLRGGMISWYLRLVMT